MKGLPSFDCFFFFFMMNEFYRVCVFLMNEFYHVYVCVCV